MTPLRAAAPLLIAAFAYGQEPFQFDAVRARARQLASRPHEAPKTADLPQWLDNLDFDAYRRIRFREETSLWGGEDLPFKLQFSHRGYLFPARVPIHVVDGVRVEELRFQPAQFQYGFDLPGDVPPTLGYAGLTVLWRGGPWTEIASFRGASFFRIIGSGQHYGTSARGLAVDTALPEGEEHPAFVEMWVERPLAGADRLTLYALLDSPSISGAYRIVLIPGSSCVAEVDACLYPRRPLRKLGLAPMSSMFLHGELRGRQVRDFRPECHDSDGLLLAGADGRWSWRPLGNPVGSHRVSTYRLDSPVGFGLLQRDRLFSNYLDLGDRYELRPSLWVAPRGSWGEGAVELLEIPTDVVHNDNIACYWIPARVPGPGEELTIAYTLSAFGDDAARPPLARVRNTLLERGESADRFLIDFEGPQLGDDPAALRADISTPTGQIRNVVLQRNEAAGGMRCAFDVLLGGESTELRVILLREGRQVTEAWVMPWQRP